MFVFKDGFTLDMLPDPKSDFEKQIQEELRWEWKGQSFVGRFQMETCIRMQRPVREDGTFLPAVYYGKIEYLLENELILPE